MGVVSPLGNTVDSFWEGLCAGKSGIRAVTLFDASQLPSRIAGQAPDPVIADFSNKDYARRDRCTLLALAAADQAWKQAGIDLAQEDPERCGVALGTGIGGLETIQDNVIAFATKGPRRVSPFAVPKCLCNIPAGEVAIRYGLFGPNKSVVTACTSGAQSIADAGRMIQLGLVDVMVTGGVEASIIPFGMAAFGAMRALSCRNDEPERASRPFDADRDGFVMGEGAGILVLESEAHARARGAEILGVVAGAGETCDAYHITAPRPDGSGAVGAMRAALRAAKLNPGDVDYFNAHGTSTKYNDMAESIALRVVFDDSMPPLSSTKSMIGHLLGAAGAVEAIACIKSIETGVMHPSINFETPDPECPVNLIVGSAREGKVDVAMSNSLAFGGHNASLILTRYNGQG